TASAAIALATFLLFKRGNARTVLLGGCVIVLLLLLKPLAGSANHLLRPQSSGGQRQDVRPVLAYIRDHREATDRIYVYHHQRESFLYYKARFGFGEGDYVLGEDERSHWKDKTNDSYRSDMDQLSVCPRVWLLFGFVRKIKGVDEERYLTNYLDEVGSRL